MIKIKNGFTLLELLVVVLIIGILAAIALPQYKLAVEKTKSAEALTVLQSILRAQQNYYLANGVYTKLFSDLDISLPGNIKTFSNREQLTLSSGWAINLGDVYTHAINKSSINTIVFNYYPRLRYCHAKQDNKIANKVCKSLGGKSPHNANNCAIGKCTVYTL